MTTDKKRDLSKKKAASKKKPAPKAKHRVMTFREVDEQLPIDGMLETWNVEEVWVYDGLTRLDAIDLDSEVNIIVNGDLVVKKDITNLNGAANLVVLGDVTARNLIAGPSEIVITGKATIRNAIYAHYNHGILTIHGAVKAKAVISLDHDTNLGGPVTAVTVSGRGSISADFDESDFERVMTKAVLREEYIDDQLMFAHLAAGKSPVKRNVKPTRLIVEEALATLRASGEPITELDLAGKKLTEFPEQLTELKDLRSLVLDYNDIGKIPASISELSQLKKFSLFRTRAVLPEEIAELEKLEELELSYFWQNLPQNIGKLENLRVLRLAEFNSALPESFGDLQNLEELQLRGGSSVMRYTEFPNQLLKLKNLRTLDIRGHAFASIPSLAPLEGLEELLLGNSMQQLEEMPNLTKLPALRSLYLSGGHSRKDDPTIPFRFLDEVMSLTSLERLCLIRWGEQRRFIDYEHQIFREAADAPPDQLCQLTNLKFLDLAFNGFRRLPTDIGALSQLEELWLQNNPIDEEERKRITAALPNTRIYWDQSSDFGSLDPN